MIVSCPSDREDTMRTLGHFLVFVAFFLVFAAAIGLCLLGADRKSVV
mgnify:CR=1 FL=1